MRQLEPGLTTDLTERQEEVLDFIEDFITREKMPPTRAEIAKHFGFKSANGAHEVVLALVKKKRIQVLPDIPRGIRLSDEWRLADR